MMRFDLDEDVILLRRSVRDLCEQQIVPHARAWDAAGQLPASLLKALGAMGLLGMCVPEERGGAGLSMVAAATLLEELAAADGAVALTVAVHNFSCLGPMLRRAHGALEGVVTKLASGEALGTWAVAEPGVASDAGAAQATARRNGSSWVLHGRKSLVVQGAAAERFVVIASTDPEQGADALVSFVVERTTKGIVLDQNVRTLGMRAAGSVDVRFEDVHLDDEHCLARPGLAHRDMLEMRTDRRIANAAIACGLASAAIAAARDYARQREQFGRPIANFQAIQWKLADMATNLDAARLLMLRAAWLRDQGEDATGAAAQAKVFASSRTVSTCSEALQIHGGYGYTEEFPVERLLRDARYCPIADGTDELQRITIAQGITARFAPREA